MCGNPRHKICTASLDNRPLIDGFVRRPSPAPGRTQVPSSYCLTSLRFWLRSDTFQPSWVRLPGVSDADLAGRAGPDGCRRSRCVQIAKELTRHSQYPTRWVTCARRRPCFRNYQAFARSTPPPSRGAEGAERKEWKGPPTFCKGKGYQPSGPWEMWMAPTSLAAVVSAWPELPEALKAGIVAMVKAAAGQ